MPDPDTKDQQIAKQSYHVKAVYILWQAMEMKQQSIQIYYIWKW